jgi:hypothetical protein
LKGGDESGNWYQKTAFSSCKMALVFFSPSSGIAERPPSFALLPMLPQPNTVLICFEKHTLRIENQFKDGKSVD